MATTANGGRTGSGSSDLSHVGRVQGLQGSSLTCVLVFMSFCSSGRAGRLVSFSTADYVPNLSLSP